MSVAARRCSYGRRPRRHGHTGGRQDCHYFSRVILPHAIGNVTCAGMGPRDATDALSVVAAGMPWMKTTRRSRSSFWPSNALAKAACRALSETVSLVLKRSCR